MFLLPQEVGFLLYLKKANIVLNELEFPENKLIKLQPQLELLISKNYHLAQLATQAYRSYLNAYNSTQLKLVFDINRLSLPKVAKSFGFEKAPHIHFSLKIF